MRQPILGGDHPARAASNSRRREEEGELDIEPQECHWDHAEAHIEALARGADRVTARFVACAVGGAIDAMEEGALSLMRVTGRIDHCGLEAESVDLVLFVDAYHEFSHPREMMESIVTALKPGGRVFLVEYRLEDPTVAIKLRHKMSEQQARLEMEAVGLAFVENIAALPQQHILVFRR